MLDVGWTELVVIAIVLIIVVGPKDLPPMLRTFGKMMSKMRGVAADFRHQFDEALREADLDDVRKTLSEAQKLNPANSLREAMNPLRQMGNDIKADLQKATRPDEKAAPVMSEIPPAPEIAASVATPPEQPSAPGADVAPLAASAHPAASEPVVPFPGNPVPVAAAPVIPVTSPAPSLPSADVTMPATSAAAVPLADGARVSPKPRKRAVKAENAGGAESAANQEKPVAPIRKAVAKAAVDGAPAKPRKRAQALAGEAGVAEIGAKISRRKKAVAADAAPETPITPKSGDEA
ncbi:Sec-independent protein translocase protein TatB [Rhizobium sp. Leaf341]|uniref:Sec-independent protein translocase protein TatB n=1 Tax=Rhizobium sp. Leaf341 TaxID=1736344 RepID=UPI0009EB34BF|nr:Sec-independent protein translocase protein TatB [Rhizobium sp. Leaf341]